MPSGFRSGIQGIHLLNDCASLIVSVFNTVNNEEVFKTKKVPESFAEAAIFREKPLAVAFSILIKLGPILNCRSSLWSYRRTTVSNVFNTRDVALQGAIYFTHQEATWVETAKKSRPELIQPLNTQYLHLYSEVQSKIMTLIPIDKSIEVLFKLTKSFNGKAVLQVAVLAFNVAILTWDVKAGPVITKQVGRQERTIDWLTAPKPLIVPDSQQADWLVITEVLVASGLLSKVQAELINEIKQSSLAS
eukprot:GILI01025486.1.p1 GENE.GILI01025486.1~~GILI01025486.1.p1  ORF type:complete len:264 (-),score=17.82 GILI01025486.1:159-899(-)